MPSAPGDQRTLTQVRAARNQSLCREVRERGQTSSFVEFVCECALDSCTELMPMTVGEYESVRAIPAHFAIRPGHEILKTRRVVGGATDRYAIVAQLEAAAQRA